MSDEEPTDTEANEAEGVEIPVDTEEGDTEAGGGARERLEEEADRARSEFDSRVVDILSWVLDTETRARIYVQLRKAPWSTSEEVAEGTGLYPSTVREALAELYDEGVVDRRKRESEGAGNNPYEYTAIAPSDLVGNVVGRVQDELNTLFNLDSHLEESEPTSEPTSQPVSIEVSSEDEEDEEGEEENVEGEEEDVEGEEENVEGEEEDEEGKEER
ncbi:helix-turn-helix domain-containing protein [Halanaeroarchaeum sulfurireducens]|uniref:helix-turn-helix domain-containing protein n=1 Tax=Halanaeroarchaeum sulfurireducens TaxID=1604004 RepID=UPI000679466E|nr:helix-turn-helix domain-containing protein [Halanaeroarchaeum sulfurireducens]